MQTTEEYAKELDDRKLDEWRELAGDRMAGVICSKCKKRDIVSEMKMIGPFEVSYPIKESRLSIRVICPKCKHKNYLPIDYRNIHKAEAVVMLSGRK